MEANTERQRDDGRKEKTQGDKSVGYSEGTGSQGGLVWLLLHLPFGLVFHAIFPGEKEGRELQKL